MSTPQSYLQQLFSGSLPSATNTYTGGGMQVPTWLLNDTNAALAQANAVAGIPYQNFPGPRVAPWTGAQTGALQQVQALQGAYQPGLNAAGNLAMMGAMNPQFGNAQGYLPQASNYINQAVTNPTSMMNPYIGNVIQKAQDLTTQYWNQQLMPSIQNTYTAAGQPGSTAQTRALTQAAQPLVQNIQDTANAALAGGYQTAQQAGLAGGQAMGNLAQLTGGLGYEQGILGLQGAGQLGNLASMGQNLGLQGAGTLFNLGQQQQQQGQQNLNTAYQDWMNQTMYPQSQLSWLSSMIRGTASPSTTGYATTNATSGYLPGTQYGPSPLTAAMGMYGAGASPQTSYNPYSAPQTPGYNPYGSNLYGSSPYGGYGGMPTSQNLGAYAPMNMNLGAMQPQYGGYGYPVM